MRIISIVSQKGGVGKTTTALALATLLREKARSRVCLIDVDPQASSSWWYDHALAGGVEPPFECITDTDPDALKRIRDLSDTYDDVIVDTPPSLREEELLRAVLEGTDYVIVPTPPAALDVVAARKTITNLVQPTGLPHRALFTRVDSRGAATTLADAHETFAAMGIPTFNAYIRELKAHPDGQADGRLISAFSDRGARKALDDYQAVTMELLGELSRPTTN
jgi:chromosome partitioning protein